MIQTNDLSMTQRIEQMAKNLAVASIFSQHPEQDDDFDRVVNGRYLGGLFELERFYVCEDFMFDHAESIIERLELERDKLKDFAHAVLAVKQVWRIDLDWDGGVVCDVVIGNQCQARDSFIETINSILGEEAITAADLDVLQDAVGEYHHPFWQTYQPFIYQASMNEVTDGQ
jgi:hypothetical protein